MFCSSRVKGRGGGEADQSFELTLGCAPVIYLEVKIRKVP